MINAFIKKYTRKRETDTGEKQTKLYLLILVLSVTYK